MKKNLSTFASLCALLLLAGNPVWGDEGQTDLALFTSPWNINLGTEFPGAKGTFEIVDLDGGKAAKLTYDFSGGGAYVAGGANITIPEGVTEFRFKVKSDHAEKIMVRLVDSTGQTLQYVLPYNQPGEWQVERIDFASKPLYHFNGAKDGKVHLPISRIFLAVNKTKEVPQGEVYYKDGVTLK